MKNSIILGSRGSNLARIQAEEVQKELLSCIPGLSVEIRIYTTKGDRILDSPLSQIGDKGLFIRELEEALLSGEIDAAVHSMKDLPTELPSGLHIGATLERGEVRDAFISSDNRRLERFNGIDSIGTSSLRRRAQLLGLGQGFSVVDIRGNVDTRLRKMDEGYCQGIILAGAGLVRSGLASRITEMLEMDRMLPAACQGIIGIESRIDDEETAALLGKINHDSTMLQAKAERIFLHTLEGGCQVPIGCRTSLNETEFEIEGLLSSLNGEATIRDLLTRPVEEAEQAAEELALKILLNGGKEILDDLR